MKISRESVEQTVAAIVESLQGREGPLMPILHAVQSRLECIPPAAVPVIADMLNLSRAEVHGVIHFYHDFRAQPPGQFLIKVCRAEACQSMGSAALEQHVQHRLGITYGETTADGRFSLEPVYCLGHCACSPSLQVGDRQYARVDEEKFDTILQSLEGNA